MAGVTSARGIPNATSTSVDERPSHSGRSYRRCTPSTSTVGACREAGVALSSEARRAPGIGVTDPRGRRRSCAWSRGPVGAGWLLRSAHAPSRRTHVRLRRGRLRRMRERQRILRRRCWSRRPLRSGATPPRRAVGGRVFCSRNLPLLVHAHEKRAHERADGRLPRATAGASALSARIVVGGGSGRPRDQRRPRCSATHGLRRRGGGGSRRPRCRDARWSGPGGVRFARQPAGDRGGGAALFR